MTSDTAMPRLPISYGEEVESALAELVPAVAELPLADRADARWLALRLLEEEPVTTAVVANAPGGTSVLSRATAAGTRIREATGVPAPLLIADRRYTWAHELAGATVSRETVPRSLTDRLDDVLTHRWLGLPIFLALMWLTFTLVVEVADPFIGWIEELTAGPLTRIGSAVLAVLGLADSWVAGMLLDGLLAGVGGVLVFLPVLIMLYLALGALEDSGYMARAAFLMDRIMAPIGLSGRSFLPLLLGFGCNVPAVAATRVLERRRDRIITGLLVPFVSCAARLPVYVLLATIFFTEASGTVVFAMYLLSIATVLVMGAVLDRVLLRSERSQTFILELPAYHRPAARVLGSYVGRRVGAFVKEAGPVIVAGAVGVWFLLAIPVDGHGSFGDTDLDDSAFAATSRAVAPTMEPAGFGSWEVTGTLLTGLVAKEIVVASFWQVYDVEVAQQGEEDVAGLAAPLRDGLTTSSGGHPAAAAVALMVFVLLYVPCFATVGALKQELGARWALLSVGLSLTVAWLAATTVFQLGRLLGLVLGGG
ncbi:MAG: ferrous iron transport protein B [Nitriliruptoraceae bacterium]